MIDPLETLLVDSEWHAVELKRDRGGDYLQEAETGNGITLAELVKRYNALLRSPAPAATVTGWRLLEVGEVVMEGDEWLLSAAGNEWIPVNSGMIGVEYNGAGPFRRRLTPPAQGDEMRAVVDALVSVRDYYEQKVEDWEDCESCGKLNELCPEHGLMYALLLLTDPEQDADFTPYALRDAIAKAAAVTYSAVAAVREGSGRYVPVG